MTHLDWIVMIATMIAIPSFGLWRGRGGTTTSHYLLAGKTMPWYAMGLSIMATQASAITFIATTGQAYVDGMRFVQFYFGLPIAMVILAAPRCPFFTRPAFTRLTNTSNGASTLKRAPSPASSF